MMGSWAGYLFVIPLFAFIITFLFFPVFYSFYISLFHYDPFKHNVYFTGLSNYITALHSYQYIHSLYRVAEYTIIVVTTQTFLAFGLALVFNQRFRITRVARAIVIVPAIISSVAASLLFEWVFSVSGPINYIRSIIGLGTVNYFYSAAWAFPAIMAMNIFSTSPYFMIFYLAGLQSIPTSIFDAAAVDGVASPIARFRYIYWPLLGFTTIIVVILGVIGSFQLFDQIYVITNGGPSGSTTSPLYLIYENAFTAGNGALGLAAAESVVLFAVILVLTVVQSKYLRQARWA